MDEREMYAEMNALLGSIAKAFDLEPQEAVRAVETGEVSIKMCEDFRGERYLAAQYRGRSANIYQGAIQRPPLSGASSGTP